MNEHAKKLYDERLKRFHDAVALKEPDRVPIIVPSTMTFDSIDAGYTMADTIYDYEKYKDAVRKFLTHYEPDSGYLFGTNLEGYGRVLDIAQPKTILWAGMPNREFDPKGVHQFLEFELLNTDELPELSNNLGEFVATKFLPRAFGVFEPMQNINFKCIPNVKFIL